MSASKSSGWGFARDVVAPTVLAFLLTIGQVAGFMMFSIERTDASALERQSTLLSLAMDDLVHQATHIQLDLAVWDEALTAYADADTDWFANNFGREGLDEGGRHRDYILNPDLTPFLAMRGGGIIPASDFEQVRATVAPPLDALSSVANQAALASYRADNRADPPLAIDIAVIENQPAIIGVTSLVSDSLMLSAVSGMEPIYVAVTLLDAVIAKILSDKYLLHGGRFDDHDTVAEGEAAIAVNNMAGDPVAWFKWLPDRPGRGMVHDFLPALGTALLIAAIIVTLLLRNLRNAGAQLHAERADAQYRAMHDPLTGLGNRALFRDQLEQAFRHLPRAQPSMALLALDLDRFKQVNDTLGHDAGDELLRQVSTRISSVLRPTDTLARLGGDEFAIIQTGISNIAEAATLASRVLSVVRPPYDIASHTVEIGVSIGIATAPDNALTENELVLRADDALYRAKTAGRDRFCFYDAGTMPRAPSNDDDAQGQLALGFA